jgi:hypothetical protein
VVSPGCQSWLLVRELLEAAIAHPNRIQHQRAHQLDRICDEKGSVRHLLGRFGDPAALRRRCEAGPCGFELHKLLASMGMASMWSHRSTRRR